MNSEFNAWRPYLGLQMWADEDGSVLPKGEPRKVLTKAGGVEGKTRLYIAIEGVWLKDWVLNSCVSPSHFQATGRSAIWHSPSLKNLNDFSWKGYTT